MNAERQGFTQRGVDFNMKSAGVAIWLAGVPARLFFRPLVRTLVPKGWMLEDASGSALNKDVAGTDGHRDVEVQPLVTRGLKALRIGPSVSRRTSPNC